MFSKWFVIEGQDLWDEDYLKGTPWTSGGNRWGRKLGGYWCLDYWFKLAFNLSNEFWETRCYHVKTNNELYKLFDDLGVAYKKDNVIRYKGKMYDNKLKEIL